MAAKKAKTATRKNTSKTKKKTTAVNRSRSYKSELGAEYDTKFVVRTHKKLCNKIAKLAKSNDRSINSEINVILKEYFDKQSVDSMVAEIHSAVVTNKSAATKKRK